MNKAGKRAERLRGGDEVFSPNRRLPPQFDDNSKRVRDFQQVLQNLQSQRSSRVDSEFRRKRTPLFVPAKQAPQAPSKRAQELRARTLMKLQALPQVRFCRARKERREVLFALNRAGYSGSAKKKFWRRRSESQWRC